MNNAEIWAAIDAAIAETDEALAAYRTAVGSK